MKKTIFYFLTIICFSFIGQLAKAQGYQMAAGLKFGGYENGVSFKYFTDPTVSLEGVLGFRDNGVVVTGLYELNVQAFDVPGLNFYYGGGVHIGAIGSGTYQTFNGNNETYNQAQRLFGLDGVVGLEYLIPKSPIAISLDLNPRIELIAGPFIDIAPGLGIKYTF